jgi:hypothetical protein
MIMPHPTSRSAASRSSSAAESGVALILTLIFSILLYILVAELVVSGRMVRATGENDALLARMRTQMVYELDQACDQLKQDLAGAAAEGEGGAAGGPGGALGGALGGAAGGAAGGAGGAEGEGGEETDPSTTCDSSRDAWFQPVGKPDNDLTTYVWVEDENRKFNILALWSPDEKFAEFSRDRLVRLIDTLREDSDFDVSSSDAERIVQELKDWVTRADTDAIPRPVLKSDDPKKSDVTIPLHLDELLMLPSVTEDLFYDKVLDGKVYLGLESVLTIWTSLAADPGDPQKVARQKAEAQANGETPSGAAGAPGEAGGASGSGAGSGTGAAAPGGAEAPPQQPMGEGIRININTASRPVLRALFPPEKMPDRVIDAIIKWRNEESEDEKDQEGAQPEKTEVSDFGNMRLGQDKKLKFFATVADLEQVEEFAKLPDPQMKADFQKAITTKSDVFSIHLATLYKRSEENRVYLLRRARAIVQRIDDGADGKIRRLIPWEERTGLRLQPVDMQDEALDLRSVYMDMDQFAQEDRAWNPFLIDFYLPNRMREEFYSPR